MELKSGVSADVIACRTSLTAPTASSVFARRKLLQYCEQRRQPIAKHNPHKVKTHVAITVDEAVAHARDLAPRNFLEGSLGGAADTLPAASPIICRP